MAENTNPNPDPQPQQPAPQQPTAPQQVGNFPVAAQVAPTVAPPAGSDQTLNTAGLYGENGQLTHAGMRKQIRSGGSVIHNGRQVVREQDLPSPAEVAQRDVQHAQALLDDARQRKDYVAAARAQRMLNDANAGSQQTTADIDSQIAELQRQRQTVAQQADAKAKK